MADPTAPTPIQVNLNVEIEADSALDIFGEAAPIVSNVVVAEVELPVNALYATTQSAAVEALIELWEPADAQGTIKAKLASTNSYDAVTLGEDMSDNGAGAYKKAAKRLAKGLQKLLCGTLDASAAVPFVDYSDNSVEYYKPRDFGRLALAVFAESLFGHVDATAAITNDKAFVEHMLSLNAQGDNEAIDASGVAARYGAWTKKGMVDGSSVLVWNDAANSSDANLAVRLAKAIVAKGLSGETLVESAIADNNAASLANIVKQVVGQDVSRLMNADSSQRTVDKHIALRFYEDDVIYVNIKIKTPTVTVSAGQNVATGANLAALYANEQSYTLKITLGAADASLDA
jgi:hypothetical protein